LGPFWDHFGTFLGPIWDHFRTSWGPFGARRYKPPHVATLERGVDSRITTPLSSYCLGQATTSNKQQATTSTSQLRNVNSVAATCRFRSKLGDPRPYMVACRNLTFEPKTQRWRPGAPARSWTPPCQNWAKKSQNGPKLTKNASKRCPGGSRPQPNRFYMKWPPHPHVFGRIQRRLGPGIADLGPFWAILRPFWSVLRTASPKTKFWSYLGLRGSKSNFEGTFSPWDPPL
jgi:hypothetical protein